MSKSIIYISVLISLLSATIAGAQVKASEDTTISVKKGVIVYADPRLGVLLKKHRDVREGVIRSGRGYRIQIYYGTDRGKATETKIDFMRRFPDVLTYMTYAQPQFRVKVGNYRTRAEAMEMYREAKKIYTSCMIVPDIIIINTLRDD